MNLVLPSPPQHGYRISRLLLDLTGIGAWRINSSPGAAGMRMADQQGIRIPAARFVRRMNPSDEFQKLRPESDDAAFINDKIRDPKAIGIFQSQRSIGDPPAGRTYS